MFATPSLRHTRRAAALLVAALLIGCSDTPGPVAPLTPSAPNAQAGTVLIVTNTDNAGPGSLRQAVLDAVSGDVIQFDPSIAGQTISLTSGPVFLDGLVTIEGPAGAGMTISGSFLSQVFYVLGGFATFRNLSIVHGRTNDNGGGIFVGGSALLDHVLVADNHADAGGGIAGAGNTHLTLLNSTLSGNTADGGGAVVSHGTLTMYNSTIVNNTAITIGGGLAIVAGTAHLRNSIVANNTLGASMPSNCEVVSGSTLLASGANLSNSAECGPGFSVADPLLGPLADNGGPTKTHALLFGSPAIDLGTSCTEATDQRHVSRPQGSTCDVGAFEFDAFRVMNVAISPNVAVNAKTGVATVTGTISCPGYSYSPLRVTLNQTQKTRGKFTTIIQAQADLPAVTCTSAPSSWSATLTPATGQFASGTATASASVTSSPGGYVPGNVTSPVKLFQVK